MVEITNTKNMRYLTVIFATLLFLSCSKADDNTEKKDCTEVEFNSSFLITLDEEVCFPDGSGFIVKTITEEFCPCDAVCIWAGELRVLVETIAPNGDKDLFTFGSSNYNSKPELLPHAKIESFTFKYEAGKLPDCENDFDATKIILNLKLVEE
jgi:hypothetical protein